MLLLEANQRYHENGMLVNESKQQGVVLGDTETVWIFLSSKGHFRDFLNENR